MKFADPQSVTCPRCGERGSYTVKALLALEAKCAVCGNSFAEIGEDMRLQLKEVDNYIIAARLASEIEELDGGIEFEDEEFKQISCLNGVVDATERKYVAASRANPRDAAVEIVQRAVARVFPDCSAPDGGIPLADAFPEEARSGIWT
jgi:transcription elongation factor Elf1